MVTLRVTRKIYFYFLYLQNDTGDDIIGSVILVYCTLQELELQNQNYNRGVKYVHLSF